MSATHAADPVLRRARLAKVHIARKQLALEEDSYRALLRRMTGKDSASAMAIAELDLVLNEFKRLGFSDAPARRFRKPAHHPHVRKVFALWWALKPHLQNGSDGALRAFVRRQTKSDMTPDGVSAPEFLDPEQANLVIEGLKAWLAREKARRAGEQPSV